MFQAAKATSSELSRYSRNCKEAGATRGVCSGEGQVLLNLADCDKDLIPGVMGSLGKVESLE